MPSLSIIRSSIAELPNGPPLVAACAGGTTAIGSYVVKSLARTFAKNGSKLRVYIVGRNVARAEAVMAECKQISPGSDWHFVHATDLALISEVDRACAEIIRRETEAPFHGGPIRLDMLYMSHCYHILKEPTVTKEGLDAFISTTYYSRVRFVTQLIPLLTASPLAGRVISIYAGGFEDGASIEDPPLGCPPPATYGIAGVRKHTSYMKNFVFEKLAEDHAGHLSLTHVYPGLVDGPGFYLSDNPLWFKICWRLFKPILWLYMTPSEDCGDVMLYFATKAYPARGVAKDPQAELPGGGKVVRGTDGELGSGAYAAGQRADTRTSGMSYAKVRPEGMRQKVWEHTIEVFKNAEKQISQEA